ncbi:hypothetical protein BDF20DRAFT_845928 [Mycotypha africana]|uniref:uncharacterized protein n=1 Tax=Mycotypha africana TaxID=64632 RepID=UPI0022FFE3BD|nr:uncharacterized protein BDF20DRAFT_845928 [Mycotypha africana]KAI8991709.1 hypothetical protein BDF20DRAFT_845928 [Mycotypha africana]
MDNNPFRKQQQNTAGSNGNYLPSNMGNSTPQQPFSSNYNPTGYGSLNPSQSNFPNQQQQPWEYQQNSSNSTQPTPAHSTISLSQNQPFISDTYSQAQQPFSPPLPTSAQSPQQPTSSFGITSSISQQPYSLNSYAPQTSFANGFSTVPSSNDFLYNNSNKTSMMSPTSNTPTVMNSNAFSASTSPFSMPTPQSNVNSMYNSSNNQFQQPSSSYQQPNQPFHFMPHLGMTNNAQNGMLQPQQQQQQPRHAPVDASTLLKGNQIRKVECPVCNKMLEGDDIAINYHVNQHYN